MGKPWTELHLADLPEVEALELVNLRERWGDTLPYRRLLESAQIREYHRRRKHEVETILAGMANYPDVDLRPASLETAVVNVSGVRPDGSDFEYDVDLATIPKRTAADFQKPEPDRPPMILDARGRVVQLTATGRVRKIMFDKQTVAAVLAPEDEAR